MEGAIENWGILITTAAAKLSVPYSNLAKVERKEDGVERRCGRINL